VTSLRAEWTKFRSVRGWVVGTAVAALLIVLFAVLAGLSGVSSTPVPLGPDGTPVVESYYFVHRPLTGDGQITVAVSSLTPLRTPAPWAKAGLLVTAGSSPGARYAAIMVTGGHGVRMQHDYRYDVSGPAAARLRLTRSGSVLTGEASADGVHWKVVDTVRLPGLAATVQIGLFVACPPQVDGLGTRVNVATALFSGPRLTGGFSGGTWAGEQVGTSDGYPRGHSGGFAPSGDGFAVTGTGDLAPATRLDLGAAGVVSDILFGTFPALIVVVVVATLVMTTEYRYTMIRSTLSADPRRGRVLVAKALVVAGATFVTSLLASVLAVPIGFRLARAHGVDLWPATSATLLRVEVGTAAMLAVVAVFALGVGAIVRRSATAVSTVVVATVVPYLLVLTPFLPPSVAHWLTRLTPTAALAVQQTLVRYPQVDTLYTPYNGYYPLPPWGGLAVLCGYAVVSLVIATVVLRRRDA
jgi:ABC-type transport system involved in multi-copper enzyme maturation permease subunit